MTKPTNAELQLQKRYLVPGRGSIPYSLAIEHTDYPRYCIIGDQHEPAEARSNLCFGCWKQLKYDLELIHDRWDNLDDALMTSRRPSDGERAGSSTEGSAAPIDLRVSEAMGLARHAVYSILRTLVEDQPFEVFTTTEGTWALAGRLARRHVGYIASHPDEQVTEAAYIATWKAARDIEKVTHPPITTQPIESHCHQFHDPGDGSRRPCPGQLVGVVMPDGTTTIQCSEDPDHWIPMDEWLMLQTRRDRLAKKYTSAPTRRLRGASQQGA
ncbi:hypothetical protein [Arthrobacter sp. B1805]|uniref:hypothetical protein n=1 Tax=Arthrobacter sp. B1805 TaxID=2058892 RepID=UPI000CE2CF50|nr:hypothetical protein [Arthrobacter sp. B1805]